MRYGIQASFSFQRLPGYRFGTPAQYALTGNSGPSGITTNIPPNGAGTVWLITPTTTYDHLSGQLRGAGLRGRRAGRSGDDGGRRCRFRLVAPNTEYGDRINQLDSVSPKPQVGRATIQPKIDFFNLLNVSPVIDLRTNGGVELRTPPPTNAVVGAVGSRVPARAIASSAALGSRLWAPARSLTQRAFQHGGPPFSSVIREDHRPE